MTATATPAYSVYSVPGGTHYGTTADLAEARRIVEAVLTLVLPRLGDRDSVVIEDAAGVLVEAYDATSLPRAEG
jgi:hypothetical protein